MKVVIAGAGEVGTHLAKMLQREDLDITLIDSSSTRVKEKREMDLFAQNINPTSLSGLRQIGVQDTDLFVGVMPEESDNLTACILASRLGAKRTLARINNHEYLEQENIDFFVDLGVNSLIYPEDLAADEIVAAVRYPWARQFIELFNGSLILVGVKVRHGASLVGKYLYELDKENGKLFHIVAIKRDFETIIPTGRTRVEHGDLVFFTCTPNNISTIRRIADKRLVNVRKVVIMGASRTALRAIARIPSDIKIYLIERDKEKALGMTNHLPVNVRVFHGDGRDPALLHEVGIEDTDVFVALTENSETNVMACLAAKQFGVFKTVAKEENIDYIQLSYGLDIGSLINKKLLTAGHIYRMLLGADTSNVKCLSVANADVAEFIAKRDSRIISVPIKDLDLGDRITFGGMVRNGIPMMIDGNTVLEPYDHIAVFCHDVPMNQLKDLFS